MLHYVLFPSRSDTLKADKSISAYIKSQHLYLAKMPPRESKHLVLRTELGLLFFSLLVLIGYSASAAYLIWKE